MSHEYLLVRDADESARLIKQHDLYVKLFGYRIHPSVAKSLPSKNVRVADIGCGTGIWLIDLALSTGDPSWHFDGFDISKEQFPHHSTGSAAATAEAIKASKGTVTEGEDLSHLPDNVDMHEWDCRAPFPEKYHGTYDLIHARLMLLSLLPHEWDNVMHNLHALLRPGGWIQWEEPDTSPHWSVLRSVPLPPEGGFPHLELGMGHMIDLTRHKNEHVNRRVVKAFKHVGLKDVQTDVVSAEKDPARREAVTRMNMHVVRNVCRAQLELGIHGAWSLEKVDQVYAGMEKEVQQGGYINFYLQCTTGHI